VSVQKTHIFYQTFVKRLIKNTYISSSSDHYFSLEYVLSAKSNQKSEGATRTHSDLNNSQKVVTKTHTLQHCFNRIHILNGHICHNIYC